MSVPIVAVIRVGLDRQTFRQTNSKVVLNMFHLFLLKYGTLKSTFKLLNNVLDNRTAFFLLYSNALLSIRCNNVKCFPEYVAIQLIEVTFRFKIHL